MDLLTNFEWEHKDWITESDRSLVDSVKRIVKVDIDKAKAKTRAMVRAALGLDPDVIPASEELNNKK